ncbi:efflux RND transporter permease subunit [Pseudocolwellia sp. AS88]|uniref:efflux RND transporter permease subunit n=1 Tax=Pseudocolwellia sp. AS88 TaxID=3063958 RepID=UPI0026F0E727|nr:efflux RND transporter permease subunit [Pseudocolwellia sp. AS88]MDO7085551.1 efflux RND transporter permease subunit [Pseudocolwellia sp. AS88]
MKFSPISWMIDHKIAPHLLMLALICGGLVMSFIIRKEYMPETTRDTISVRVIYPGAAPSEMELAIAVPIEAALDSLDSVSRVDTRIGTGWMRVTAELEAGANPQKVYQDSQQAVNRISSFPSGMEQPYVVLDTSVADVMEIIVHADLDRFALKRLTEQVRDRILQSPYISQVKLRGIPEEEIHIEVAQSDLQAYDLTLNNIASILKNNVVEQSAGKIKADNGDIIVSVDQREFWAEDLANVPIVTDESGDQLRLGEIAKVTEGFADTRDVVTYNGQLSAQLNIYRMGEQTPSEIADAIQEMWPELLDLLPPNAGISIVDDDAKNYQKRLSLLLSNAFMGLVLVLIVMSLFLQFKLAFWVVAGIPSSFLGAMLFLPSFDVSINMVSMFGFIVALGIVVDDAIIAGENIYSHVQEGMSFQEAAIKGANEVAKPLTYAILTNIVAFLPLLLLPGSMKLLFGAIPIVVVLCFAVSWVEALFILPSHLAHINDKNPNKIEQLFNKAQAVCQGKLNHFIENIYLPFLSKCLQQAVLTLSIACLIFCVVITYAFSGKMGFSLYPKLDGRWVKASYEISETTTEQQAQELKNKLENSAYTMIDDNNIENNVVSVRTIIRENSVEVALLLVESEEREYSTEQVKEMWRSHAENLPNIGKLRFSGARRGSSSNVDASLTIELRHSDSTILALAAKDAIEFLSNSDDVVATVNSMEEGKPQWKLTLNENGRALGLDAVDLSTQLRSSLYGSRAQRQHRLRNQVTTLVRLPEHERADVNKIESMLIRTKGGGYAPLGSVATINKVLAPAFILRRKGQRIEKLGAEILPVENIPAVTLMVKDYLVPDLEGRYPGLKVGFGGEQEEIAQSVSSLQFGTAFALVGIYILLAIAFRSYSQPIIIMAIIPFGAVGAILGHMVLGFGLSVVSLMGMLALAGVVVNDSLILVEYANKKLEQGDSALEAVSEACRRRIRPIILTTITTFCGLAPMVFETSRQAQFVVPMAVSLGFGILFTTLVCLLVLPSLYLVINNRRNLPTNKLPVSEKS